MSFHTFRDYPTHTRQIIVSLTGPADSLDAMLRSISLGCHERCGKIERSALTAQYVAHSI